jgi:hypothetical protein
VTATASAANPVTKVALEIRYGAAVISAMFAASAPKLARPASSNHPRTGAASRTS